MSDFPTSLLSLGSALVLELTEGFAALNPCQGNPQFPGGSCDKAGSCELEISLLANLSWQPAAF